MPDEAFASFEDKWLAANPEQAVVAVFLAPEQRLRAAAFGALVHELQQAAFGASDPQVSSVKLNWWAQELVSAGNGGRRHPITTALFKHEAARAIEPALWAALVSGAFAQVESAPASTQSDTVATLAKFYQPVARLDAALVASAESPTPKAAALWIGSHRLRDLANPARVRVVPLDLLARHQLSRAQLAEPGRQRSGLLRELLQEVRGDIADALIAAPLASPGTRVRALLDLDRIAGALRTEDPAIAIAEARPSRWRSLWFAWREARRAAGRPAARPGT